MNFLKESGPETLVGDVRSRRARQGFKEPNFYELRPDAAAGMEVVEPDRLSWVHAG